MAENQYVNKVDRTVDGSTETLIDISEDTVDAEHLAAGYTAHDSSGAPVTGTAIGGSVVTVTPDLSGGTKVATITIDGSDSELYAPTPPVTSVNGETGTVTLDIPPTMTILSYGTSTWAEFMEAYSTNTIVYCRASSNSNPASGSKTRMAFMAYVNNETAPTNVEFQYYRSVSSHTATQQGDQVYVYKLDKNSGWSVITREAKIKMAAGNGLTSSFASNTLTIKLPDVTAADNGKVLQVVNGAWAVADLQ